ncbi:MAG: hypothetical protein PGN16_07535 [Sphingomonas phyllosphaerae]|uniref:hypothetical protein n=1 Tax=Sphingomonas phyllosphaerae TaxID=257003 RepID=UPI002FFC961F
MNVTSFARITIMAGTLAFFPTTAQAGPVYSAAGTVVRALPDQIAFTYRQDLLALRKVALLQQQRDGGTLSADSRASIQTRLDAINARYARTLRNNNPLSLDSTGHSSGVRTDADWTHADLLTTGRQ